MNGVEVVVLNFVKQKGRWGVQCILSQETLSVKPSNLEPSAILTERLSSDDAVCMVLEKLQLEPLTAVSIVCRSFLRLARLVARSPDWQARSLSLLQLVRYGAAPNTIRTKRDAMLSTTCFGRHAPTDELFEVARHAVRSHALVETLHAVLHNLPPELRDYQYGHYQYDLCRLQHAGDDDDDHFDEDRQTLLHHAAMCGAGPSVVSMLLLANRDTVHEYDANGFLPLHHAVMRGTSPWTVRTLLQRTDAVDFYEPIELAGTLLHLALNGGGNPPFGAPAEPPLTDVQNEIVTVLLEELPVPLAEWDDFVPPVEDADERDHRLPLHLAAIAGASASVVAALLAAHPPAAKARDRAPSSPDLRQPYGYLPAHALGAARDGLYSTCRACSPEVQELILEAYPPAQWPMLDLVRAGLAGAPFLLPKLEAWSNQTVQDHTMLARDEHSAGTLPEGEALPESEMLLHMALAHAAPPEVVTALLCHHPRHAECISQGRVHVLPLHLAQTAAAVEALLTQYPKALHKATSGDPPYCEPLAYAYRNGAPAEVTLALTRAVREARNQVASSSVPAAANERADTNDALLDAARSIQLARGERASIAVEPAYLANDALVDKDAFGNPRPTHPKLHMRKCSSRDMRKLWKELPCELGDDEGLLGHSLGAQRLIKRLLGTDHAFEEGASALLAATVEGDAGAVRVLLDGGGQDVNSASRPWGCDCSNRGGCDKCAGRRLPGGWTPLHEACLQGRADLVELLLAAGADRTCEAARHRRGGGTTPLTVALDQGHTEVARLLEAAGAPLTAAIL